MKREHNLCCVAESIHTKQLREGMKAAKVSC